MSGYSKLSEKAKKSIITNANKYNKKKREAGEYKQLSIAGKAQEIETIRNAIQITGKSNIKGLFEICQQFIDNQLK